MYLPRKFKIGISAPGDNCVDVLINDLAIVPMVGTDGGLRAFTLFVGGGLGKTHAKPATYPRLATPLTTVAPADLIEACEAVVKLHRDHGDRANREHARLKYVIDDLGDERSARSSPGTSAVPCPPRSPSSSMRPTITSGWHEQGDGSWFLGVKVASGRIADHGDARVRSGIRAVVERFGASVRFTAREDVLLCDLAAADHGGIAALLDEHGVRPAPRWIPIARNSFACPALPTCSLALAESERALPALLDELHETLVELDLGEVETHVRMTGCPNGCARPYSTEMAFVGRGKNRYDIHLGGERVGVRLNEIFAENVPRSELVGVLRPVFARFAEERADGEELGNWCHRVGVAKLRAELGNEQWVRKPRAAAST